MAGASGGAFNVLTIMAIFMAIIMIFIIGGFASDIATRLKAVGTSANSN